MGVVSKGTWVSYYQANVTITLGRREFKGLKR